MLRLLLCCALLTLTACSKPLPPEKERPVEPQAHEATELRDAIQAPIDRAKAVDDQTEKAADAQRQAIEAAGG